MASPKSVCYQAALLVLLITVLVAQQSHTAEAQVSPQCTSRLNNLNSCAPFVVPGAANPQPSAQCCAALQAVDHDCVCNTLRIASRLPSLCNIPPLSCDAN